MPHFSLVQSAISPPRYLVKINSLMFAKYSDAAIIRAAEVLPRKLITLASNLDVNDVQLWEEGVA